MMRKTRVVFVEDKPAEIEDVLTTLEVAKYFDVAQFADYSLIHESRIRETDLFVLDVLTAGSDEPFCEFIATLRLHERAFIAYTRMSEHGQLRALAGEPRLRQTVFEHGGLGMVSKFAGSGEEARISRKDLQMDLIERIIGFHWSWRRP